MLCQFTDQPVFYLSFSDILFDISFEPRHQKKHSAGPDSSLWGSLCTVVCSTDQFDLCCLGEKRVCKYGSSNAARYAADLGFLAYWYETMTCYMPSQWKVHYISYIDAGLLEEDSSWDFLEVVLLACSCAIHNHGFEMLCSFSAIVQHAPSPPVGFSVLKAGLNKSVLLSVYATSKVKNGDNSSSYGTFKCHLLTYCALDFHFSF